MAKTLDLQPSKIVMTDEDTLAAYTIYAHSERIDIEAEIRPNLIHAPTGGDLQILSEPGHRLSLMTDALAEVLGFDNDDGIISIPLQAGCRVYRSSTTQTIANNTETKVAYNAKIYDVQNEYDAFTNYRYTAKKSGYYLAIAQIKWVNFSQYATSTIHLIKSGSRVSRSVVVSSKTKSFSVSIADIIFLDENDYLEVTCYQDTGSDREIVAISSDTFFTVKKLA
ncbi:MAG: hypothetical protein J7J19_03610 [Thaumarchaeota archaeon]|nr:hypothetical protein [Nitrososphaerota archaeon]